jgi:hypothetical protein
MVTFLNRSRKAIIAGLGAAVTAYTAGIQDGNISQTDAALIIGMFVVVGFATYMVPNAPAAR